MMANHGIGPLDRIEVPYIVDCWTAKRSQA